MLYARMQALCSMHYVRVRKIEYVRVAMYFRTFVQRSFIIYYGPI
jgi:hypothetical protein